MSYLRRNLPRAQKIAATLLARATTARHERPNQNQRRDYHQKPSTY